jgi:death on curing protein
MNDDVPITFLTAETVVRLHQRQLDRFGGGAGLRDRGMLESAVAQPQASFGGVFMHEGLFAMAAAYLFHIVSSHPFVDGNKRAGLLAATAFLHINGIRILHSSDALYELTMGLAEGRIEKASVAAELERIANAR